MLTIFTIPKPFRGHIATIQHNALASWTRLRPRCEIILFGADEGVAEAAAELGVRHFPGVACNEYGTPFLGPIFEQARQMAEYPRLCYVNADIILLDDFLQAAERVRFRRFLMVGQRWDLDLEQLWPFEQPDWAGQLRQCVRLHGTLHPPSGSDYFLFPRDQTVGEFPPFVVGRPGWDNWFIYRTLQLRIPLIDATPVTTVIHQNHDYSHVLHRIGQTWHGPEAEANLGLVDLKYKFTPWNATHAITALGVLPALSYRYLQRRWRALPILFPSVRRPVKWIGLLRRRFFGSGTVC